MCTLPEMLKMTENFTQLQSHKSLKNWKTPLVTLLDRDHVNGPNDKNMAGGREGSFNSVQDIGDGTFYAFFDNVPGVRVGGGSVTSRFFVS